MTARGPARRKLTPRAALSARELDRIQALLLAIREDLLLHGDPFSATGSMRQSRRVVQRAARRLTRVLGMLSRSERR